MTCTYLHIVIIFFFTISADIKLPGAEKRSRFYQKYGNPNYGGMRGLISGSRSVASEGACVEQ